VSPEPMEVQEEATMYCAKEAQILNPRAATNSNTRKANSLCTPFFPPAPIYFRKY